MATNSRRTLIVTMVRNECDIIEAFVRHHAPVVDHIHVLLHASTDATAAILDLLIEEGFALSVERDDNPAFNKESKFNSLIARAIALHDPEIIIPLDSDEFITPPDRGQIEREMKAVPEGGALWVNWQMYLPTRNDVRHEINPVRRIQHRRRIEQAPIAKVFFPCSSYRQPDVVLVDGQHHLSHRKGLAIAHVHAKNLTLAHFPLRSGDQFVSKIVLGWLSRQLSPERTSDHSREWQRWFDRLYPDYRISDDTLPDIATRYYVDDPKALVGDPIASTYSLRYTEIASMNPLARVTKFAASLVGKLGRLDEVVRTSGIDREKMEALIADRAETAIELRRLRRHATEVDHLRARLVRASRRIRLLGLLAVAMAILLAILLVR